MRHQWLGRQFWSSDQSNRHRMERAATRDRQRIIQRVWSFESLEDRALLAALSGLHNIGPTGDFASISAAISSIQSNGLDGPLVLELQPTYTSVVETFHLNFRNLSSTAVNTITLRPKLGATKKKIFSNSRTMMSPGRWWNSWCC